MKDPSPFLGEKYAKHSYEYAFNFYWGEKTEYLNINIHAILMPIYFLIS